MSQRSASNTSESKLPSLHSLTIVGVQWRVHLSCACCCHVGFERCMIFKSTFILFVFLTIAVYHYVTSLEIDDPLFLYLL